MVSAATAPNERKETELSTQTTADEVRCFRRPGRKALVVIFLGFDDSRWCCGLTLKPLQQGKNGCGYL